MSLIPLLDNFQEAFFNRGFHRFLANGLNAGLVVEDIYTANVIDTFQNIFKATKRGKIDLMWAEINKAPLGDGHIMTDIMSLISYNEQKISKEYELLRPRSNKLNKWILELSKNALEDTLTHWNKKYTSLLPIIDESESLMELKDIIDAENKYYNAPIHPILFVASHRSSSIQIADFAASAFNFAYRNPESEFSKVLLNKFKNAISRNCLFPNWDEPPTSSEWFTRNKMTLMALVENSKENNGLKFTPEFLRYLNTLWTKNLTNI